MKTLRMLVPVLVLLGSATAAFATAEMATFAPSDSKAFIETVDGAGLRQMLLESKFWAALEGTQAFKDWRASQKCAEMEERIERLLAGLQMPRDEAIRTYFGGRSAVALLPSADEKKPDGVLITEATNAMAQRLTKALGAMEIKRYRDVAIWEIRKDNRTDRMAFAGGIVAVTGASDDALERMVDVMVGGGSSLGAQGDFVKAVEGLPSGWRARAYAARAKPHEGPGAVAMYPQEKGHVHFEWRLVGGSGDISMTRPAVLTAPAALPDRSVAAIASVFYPRAVWDHVKTKCAAEGDAGAQKVQRAEMFVRGFFPGQTMDSITGAFGPEAAVSLVKGDSAGAPGLVGLVRIASGGRPVAQSFRDGLAAKAMLLAALANNKDQPGDRPRINVREEAYGATPILVVEAPAILQPILGDWAKDVALTVAVTDNWLVAGTSLSGIKATLDAARGNGASLAAAMKQAGDPAPAEPVTRWGVIQPASGADICLALAERLAGKQRVDQAKKMLNLAELLKLVKRLTWQRTDEPTVVRGRADLQAVE